jgi:hypothetical protein
MWSKAEMRKPRDHSGLAVILTTPLNVHVSVAAFLSTSYAGEGARVTWHYLCSRSTGAVTSCTLKYFASAGYFRATASYIAYATLRYDT